MKVPLEALENPTSPLPELNAPVLGPPAAQAAAVIAPPSVEVPEVDLAAYVPGKPGGILSLPSVATWRLPADVFAHLGYGARPVALLAPHDHWGLGVRRGDRLIVDAAASPGRAVPGQVALVFDAEADAAAIGDVVAEEFRSDRPGTGTAPLACRVPGRSGVHIEIGHEGAPFLGRVLGRLGLMDVRAMRAEAQAAGAGGASPVPASQPGGAKRRFEPNPQADEV